MTFVDSPSAPDNAEKPPVPLSPEQTGNLGGISEIIAHLQKGEWAPMVGAIMTLWKEYFGTPEEKEEIRRARKERKDAETQKNTKDRLGALRTNVDSANKPDDKKAESDAEITPYSPGTEKPHISPKNIFKSRVEQIYAQQDTLYTVNNLDRYFGRDYKKFLIEKDPVTGEQPITFLTRPILGGINLAMLPFLRIAEQKLMALKLNYVPRQKEVRGFQDRNMCVGNQDGKPILDPNIPSFHKYGLAVDLDPDSNWPKDGRGDIPDEVIIAMAESGFAVGNVPGPTFEYLINDTMHYQLRFPPDSAAGQEIIQASPIGRRYWEAIQPLLERARQTA